MTLRRYLLLRKLSNSIGQTWRMGYQVVNEGLDNGAVDSANLLLYQFL